MSRCVRCQQCRPTHQEPCTQLSILAHDFMLSTVKYGADRLMTPASIDSCFANVTSCERHLIRISPHPDFYCAQGLYLSDAWSELGLPRECSTWSNERIIEKWACDKEKLVAFGMGMHPRLGGAQGDDAAQRVSRSWALPTFNMGRSRSSTRPRHNLGTSAIYGMSDDVFKIVCSQVLYSAPDGTIQNR
jgi:hypothetical protein